MDDTLKECINNLGSTDDQTRMHALEIILNLTERPVDWVYEVWDDILEKLHHENSFQRSIAIKVLCNLAKSDRENRLHDSLDILLAHTRDEKFITSRQCIQSIWKVAAASDKVKQKILAHLETQFIECVVGKHYNLIRQDIIQSLRLLYEVQKDDMLLTKAQSLIAQETEGRYRKKYAAILQVT